MSKHCKEFFKYYVYLMCGWMKGRMDMWMNRCMYPHMFVYDNTVECSKFGGTQHTVYFYNWNFYIHQNEKWDKHTLNPGLGDLSMMVYAFLWVFVWSQSALSTVSILWNMKLTNRDIYLLAYYIGCNPFSMLV